MYSRVEKLDDKVLLTASIWFDQPEYLFEVPIGTPVGSLLGSVSISSDGPIGSPWYFGGGGVFDVDYGGGIFTNSVVTGSPGDEIVVNVDAYTIGAYASTTVRVTLLPSSTPQLRFTQAFYEFSVPVGTGAGSVIGNVAATGGEFPWFWGTAAEFYVDGIGDIHTNLEITGSPGDVITFSVHAEDLTASDVAVVSITLTSGTSSANQRPEFVSHDGIDSAIDSNDFYSFFFDVKDQFLYADRSVQNMNSWPYGQINAVSSDPGSYSFHNDGSYSIEFGGTVTHYMTDNPFQLWPTGWYWPNQNIFEGSLDDRVDLPDGAIVRFTVMVGIQGVVDWSDPDPNEVDVASVEITATDLTIDVSVDGLSEDDETSPGLIMRVNQDDDNHDGREDRFVADADPSQLFVDDNLVEFVVTLGLPLGVVPNGYFTLEFDASVINVWHEPDKSRPEHLASSRVTPHVTQIPLDADASDLSFWIEAKDNGSTSVNVVLYAGTPALPIRSDRIDLRAWGLDLDIDGDNNNGTGPSGNTEYEEELEESDYALGKLLIPNGWNGNLVPLTLRLAPDLDPESNDVLIRFDFDAVGQSGLVWLWNTNDVGRINQPVAQGGNRIYANEACRLGDLNYDPVTGEATVYLDARSVHPGTHDTKKQVEDNGKPVDHISATLLLSDPGVAGHVSWIADRVKFMVVGEDSFFHDMSGRSQVRASLASAGVYGAAAHSEPSDLPQFGLRKLTPEELRRLDVPDGAVLLIGTDIVPGLKSAVYRDFVTGGYWLAFAGTENLEDWINNALQGLGWDSEQYSAAMKIAFRLRESDDIQAAGMRITGHSLGGGLASAAYAASGIPADTFNAAGLHRQTLLDEMGMERYPDSLARYDAGGPGIRAWYLDWDILSLVQDNVAAMPSALGQRIPMDGPFDSRISSAAVTVAITSWLQVPVLSWGYAVYTLGNYGQLLIQADSDYQYGLLVAEDWFGNIFWDAWGYGPYE